MWANGCNEDPSASISGKVVGKYLGNEFVGGWFGDNNDSGIYSYKRSLNRFLFQGREWDHHVEAYDFRARYYSPRLGRFLSRDPMGYFDSLNLYSFVNNNPVNYRDPTGMLLFGIIPTNEEEVGWCLDSAYSAFLSPHARKDIVDRQKAYWAGVDEGGNEFIKEAALSLWDIGQLGYQTTGAVAGEVWEVEYQSAMAKWSLARDKEAPVRNMGDAAVRAGEVLELWGKSYYERGRAIVKATVSGDLKDVRAAGNAAGTLGIEAVLWGSLFTKGIIRAPAKIKVLHNAKVSGMSRSWHRIQANRHLFAKLKGSSRFTKKISRQLSHDVMKHMLSGKTKNLLNPKGTVWHHPFNRPGVVQLMKRSVHTDPALQAILHPGSRGGWSKFYGR